MDAIISALTCSMGVLSFSCFSTSAAYQVWNCLFISSFSGLLIETFSGCKLSVQLARMCIGMMCFSRRVRMPGVVCPLKQSKMTTAGCVFASFSASLFCDRSGTTISLTYYFIVLYPHSTSDCHCAKCPILGGIKLLSGSVVFSHNELAVEEGTLQPL